MNQVNELPTNTIVPYDLVRGDLQEVPECGICLDTQKKVNCIGLDRMICHRAPPSERNPGNLIYHYFHKTCLGEWLITPHSENKCPNCETVLSNESIEEELSPSLMEKGVRVAENFLRRAVRGAFYGAWSWAAVYTLMDHHRTDLGDLLLQDIIKSAVLSSIVFPLLGRDIRANPALFFKSSCAAFSIQGSLEYYLSSFQETNTTARICFQTFLRILPLMLSRDVVGMAIPEMFATAELLERKIDNWSWKAVPGLALGVASRMLFKWWGSS